jgi:hypothetical protein
MGENMEYFCFSIGDGAMCQWQVLDRWGPFKVRRVRRHGLIMILLTKSMGSKEKESVQESVLVRWQYYRCENLRNSSLARAARRLQFEEPQAMLMTHSTFKFSINFVSLSMSNSSLVPNEKTGCGTD